MLWNVDTRKIKNNRKYGFYFITKKELANKKTFFIVCKEKTNFAQKLKIMNTSKNSFNIFVFDYSLWPRLT